MNRPLDTFESNLLTSLRHEVETRAARSRRSRQRRVLATGAAAVAATVAVLFVVPGPGTTPAYSVQEGNAGEIEVEVHRFEDATGLEDALAEEGIGAEVIYVPDGGRCVRHDTRVLDRPGISMTVGEDLFSVTLAPGTVRDGETLVIDASMAPLPPEPEVDGVRTLDGSRMWVSAEVVAGDPGRCVPVQQ